jgi:hypothetical protein
LKTPPDFSSRCRRKAAILTVALASVVGVSVDGSTSVDAAGGKPDRPKRPRALVLGDSVMAMVGVAPEALAELNDITPVVFGAEGCQLLLSRGCMPGVDKSAYQRFREARGKFSDVVVVATGYNEYKDESLVDALKLFREEAKRQKVTLVWLTYRENGNVVGKAKRFNAILRRAAKRDGSLVLFDWHKTSRGRESWFSGDKVHMSRGGAKQMARRLGKVIDQVIEERRTKNSTTTTLPTTTTTLAPVAAIATETTTPQG